MTGWDVLTGRWELVQGIDTNGDGVMDKETARKQVVFGRGETISLSIPSRKNVLVQMKLTGEGEILNGYPDLAIGTDDIQVTGDALRVTVHNLGGVASPATEIALVDSRGKVIAKAPTPAMEGTNDLMPKQVQVTLHIPPQTDLKNCSVTVDPENTVKEIRKNNNRKEL
jgi:hypothetical protein